MCDEPEGGNGGGTAKSGEEPWTHYRLLAAAVVTVVSVWVVMVSMSAGDGKLGASEVVVILFGLTPWFLPYVTKVTFGPTGGEVDPRMRLANERVAVANERVALANERVEIAQQRAENARKGQ